MRAQWPGHMSNMYVEHFCLEMTWRLVTLVAVCHLLLECSIFSRINHWLAINITSFFIIVQQYILFIAYYHTAPEVYIQIIYVSIRYNCICWL